MVPIYNLYPACCEKMDKMHAWNSQNSIFEYYCVLEYYA